MTLSGKFNNELPIKGRILSDGINTVKASDYGYAALYIAIMEGYSPDKAKNVLYDRLHGVT